MGAFPENWAPFRFCEIEPPQFLKGIDFFVYYPPWVEAFGRTGAEALASGAVAILWHFRTPSRYPGNGRRDLNPALQLNCLRARRRRARAISPILSVDGGEAEGHSSDAGGCSVKGDL